MNYELKDSVRLKLTLLSFLEFAVWGAYLTSMGTYLFSQGLASYIGWFYSVNGFVSLCMPALMGIVADRWIQAQKLLGMSHLVAGLFMLWLSTYGFMADNAVRFPVLFTLYACSVACFMPTLALTNSVAYNALEKSGRDPVKAFPPIRLWGTIGFIVSMWIVDLGGMQSTSLQFGWSGLLSLVLGLYAFTLPACTTNRSARKGLVEALGLRAFSLFRKPRMAVFFVFSMLIGVCLQITNGFANPFISSFAAIPQFADKFGVKHANMLISLSQMSEACCFLLIPFFLSRFGIKRVMLIALLAWVLRFGLFALGNPGSGLWLFVLSMMAYGVAFDFFSISGSLFVNSETDMSLRSSAQGLFMMMTNGFGATVGMLIVQQVINHFVYNLGPGADAMNVWHGWDICWTFFALYALVVAVAFAFFFRYKHNPESK